MMDDDDGFGDFVAQPPTSSDHNREFQKGDAVLYHDTRNNKWIPTKILSVDKTIAPPSFCVEINGSLRETEAFKLKHPDSITTSTPPASIAPSAIPTQLSQTPTFQATNTVKASPAKTLVDNAADDDFGDFEGVTPTKTPPVAAVLLVSPSWQPPVSPAATFTNTQLNGSNHTNTAAISPSQPTSPQQGQQHSSRAAPLPLDLFVEPEPIAKQQQQQQSQEPAPIDESALESLAFVGHTKTATSPLVAAAKSTTPTTIAQQQMHVPAMSKDGDDDDDDFGDFATASTATTQHVVPLTQPHIATTTTGIVDTHTHTSTTVSTNIDDDDDFGDFETAKNFSSKPTTTTTTTVAPPAAAVVAVPSHDTSTDTAIQGSTSPVLTSPRSPILPIPEDFFTSAPPAVVDASVDTNNNTNGSNDDDEFLFVAAANGNGQHQIDTTTTATHQSSIKPIEQQQQPPIVAAADEQQEDDDDFGDFVAVTPDKTPPPPPPPTLTTTTTSTTATAIAPPVPELLAVPPLVAAVPEFKEDTFLRLLGKRTTTTGGGNDGNSYQSSANVKLSTVYVDYAVVWTQLIKAATKELIQGRQIWSEASSLGSSTQRHLLSLPKTQTYLTALGRAYFVAALARLAADAMGLLGLVDELRVAWEICHAVWQGKDVSSLDAMLRLGSIRGADSNSDDDGGGYGGGGFGSTSRKNKNRNKNRKKSGGNNTNKPQNNNNSTASTVRKLYQDSDNEEEDYSQENPYYSKNHYSEEYSEDEDELTTESEFDFNEGHDGNEASDAHELLLLPEAIGLASATLGYPLDDLLGTLSFVEERLPELSLEEFPRLLSWTEGLDGLTLLPLSLFDGTVIGAEQWCKGRWCLVPVVNVWLRCVSEEHPDLD